MEYCEKDKAIDREQAYIDLLQPQYNILTKAGSLLGFRHSEKTIAKLKVKLKAEYLTLEQNAKRLEHWKILNANPEYRAKRLEHLKRLHSNAEQEVKRLEQLNIYNSSPEHRDHLKKLHSSKEHQEQLKRLNLSMKGRPRPEGAGVPSVSVEVIDTLNGEITVYKSISEAGRSIGVTETAIRNAFKRQEEKGASTILIKKKRYQLTKLSSI